MAAINSIEDLRAHRKAIARTKRLDKIYNRAVEAMKLDAMDKRVEKTLSDGVSSSWHVLPYKKTSQNNKREDTKCFIPADLPLITARRAGQKCSTGHLYNELSGY